MDPDKTDALLKLLQDGFPQTGPPRPRPISVHRDCDGPLLTYQVTKFFRGRFELWTLRPGCPRLETSLVQTGPETPRYRAV